MKNGNQVYCDNGVSVEIGMWMSTKGRRFHYVSKLFVFYGEQNRLRKWNAPCDRDGFLVKEVKGVSVSRSSKRVNVTVELASRYYGNRTVTFIFAK